MNDIDHLIEKMQKMQGKGVAPEDEGHPEGSRAVFLPNINSRKVERGLWRKHLGESLKSLQDQEA